MTKPILPKTKSCPRCKKTKAIDQFGTRMMSGVKRPQSYCLDCRNQHGKKMDLVRKKNPKLEKVDLRKSKPVKKTTKKEGKKK